MGVLAIQAGDLYVRAAYLGALDAPHAVEDGAEPARFVTPSLLAFDDGGALLGYPALLSRALPREGRVAWRFRREALHARELLARDAGGRGLTAEAFVAVALRRIAWDAQAFASEPPALAVVVPGDLDVRARTRLATLARAFTGQHVAVIDEDDALRAAVPAAQRACVVLSIDDDALRVRTLATDAPAASRLGVPEFGLAAVRRRWLERCNADAAALAPAAEAFGDGDVYEFERWWQDVWDALNASTSPDATLPLVPLVRRSTLLPLAAVLPALAAELAACAAEATQRVAPAVRDACAAAGDAPVVVVGEPALARGLVTALSARFGIDASRFVLATPDRYARGGALVAAQGAGLVDEGLASAPHALGVLGLGEDGSTTLRPLFEAGQALPASARFTIVADRDAQKQVSVTVSRPGATGTDGCRFDFGPLMGTGVQRIGITIEWRRDGSLGARALDRESAIEVPCQDEVELVGGVPLAAARHLPSA